MVSGTLTPKPSDILRKKLDKRAQDYRQLTSDITPDRLLKTPSQKRSENFRKKLRNRDGYKVPYDYKEPEVVKNESNAF